MINQLIKEMKILPMAIFEAVVHHKYFDYKNLINKKKAIEKFLKMNRGADYESK